MIQHIMTPEEAINEAHRKREIDHKIDKRFRKAKEGKPQRASAMMPKVTNRFRVILEQFGTTKNAAMLASQVVSTSRPSISFPPKNPLEAFGLATANDPEWAPISLVLRDDVLNIVHNETLTQVYKQLAGESTFDMTIQMLDGGTVILEELL